MNILLLLIHNHPNHSTVKRHKKAKGFRNVPSIWARSLSILNWKPLDSISIQFNLHPLDQKAELVKKKNKPTFDVRRQQDKISASVSTFFWLTDAAAAEA